jgi:hypothetical protein
VATTVEVTGEVATAMMIDDVITTVNSSAIPTPTQELIRASRDKEIILNMASVIHTVTLEPILGSSQGLKEAIRSRVMVEEMSIKVVTLSRATAAALTMTDLSARNTLALLDMTSDLSNRDLKVNTKEVTPAPQVMTTDLSNNCTNSTSKEHSKLETTLLIPSVLATWTTALESLISAGTATPRMKSTPSSPRSCTSTASCSSSMTVSSSVVQPT